MYDITVDSYRDSYPIVAGRGFKFFYKKGDGAIKKGDGYHLKNP